MQIIELAAKLQSVGFSNKQARVYVAALFLGPSSVQKISQQAEINRATTYVILDELAKMGLVSESTEGKKTVFVAEPPEAIERYLATQQQDIATRRDELKDLMPSLRETSRSTDAEDSPQVRFYKGLEGSEQLSRDLLRKAKKGDTIYAVVNYDEAIKADPNTSLSKVRVKKGIASKVLYSSKTAELKKNPKTLLNQVVKADKDFKAEINLYPTKASFITYSDEQTVGILIESPKIVETLRQLFEIASKNNRQ
jgi:sugar-specific transcriptional regulator TrmB